MNRTLAVATLVLLAACSTAPPPSKVITVTGRYFSNFENSSFVPDDNQANAPRGEAWSAEFSPEAWSKIVALGGEAAKMPATHTLHLRATFTGTLSAKGHYGNLGAFDREFSVTGVENAELQP